MPKIPYPSFAAGEVSPRLGARFDQTKYRTGAETMRNLVPTLEGAARNRSGLGYVQNAFVDDTDDNSRLIPFVVSDSEAYVVVLRPGRMSFIQNGTPLFAADKSIINVSELGPLVVVELSAAHGLGTGDSVFIDGVVGATELNRRWFRVSVYSPTEVALQIISGVSLDPTDVSTYVSGGTMSPLRELTAPWSSDDIPRLRYAQSGNRMVLTVDDIEVKELTVTSGSFSLQSAVFGPTISAPGVGTAVGTAGATTIRYQVTAVSEETGEESYPCRDAEVTIASINYPLATPVTIATAAPHGRATGDRVRFKNITTSPWSDLNGQSCTITVTGASTFTLNVDGTIAMGTTLLAGEGVYQLNAITKTSLTFPTGSGNKVTISWAKVSGAIEYNIYREINGIFAYCGTSASTSFEDLGYNLDVSDTPPIERDLFDEAGKYPLAVAFFQQRLLLSGSINNSDKTYAGRIAQIWNFSGSNPTQADDSFSFVIRAEKTQAIQHVLEMSRCMVFTSSAIFTLEGDQAGALTPTDVNPRKRAEHGLGDIPPIAIGNAVIYVHSTGTEISEILPGSGEDFNSKELTVYSRHLFERNTIVAWTYAPSPDSIVWAARDDGDFLSLVYLREHEIWGWTPHTTGGDHDGVVSMCTVPENGESITYFITRRWVGPSTPETYEHRYVERMASRKVFDAADGEDSDAYGSYEEENDDVGASYVMAWDDTLTDSDCWRLTREGTTPSWTLGEADVGRVILIYAPYGHRFWCTVQEVFDADNAIVTVRSDTVGILDRTTGGPNPQGTEPTLLEPDKAPFPYEGDTLGGVTWSQSIDTITDAWHLEGREVYAVVDGNPQGPFTVSGGSFELSSPGVLVVWGLRIDAVLKTLEPENPDGETWVDQEKTIGQITVRVEETAGIEVGTSLAAMQQWHDRWRDTKLFDVGSLHTGRIIVHCESEKSPSGCIFIRQRSGLPMTVLGVYPDIEIGA